MKQLYFDFVRARHQAYLQRLSGHNPPWSNDLVIQNNKFTNVFRILDRGTQQVMQMLTEPGITQETALMRCFLYRYTNRPEPWLHFREVTGRYPMISDLGAQLNDVWEVYKNAGNPIFGNAYKMFVGKENTGKTRLDWVLDLTEDWFQTGSIFFPIFYQQTSQEERLEALKRIPRCANFMGMQILTDIGYSEWVQSHENEFIVAGPGAKVGAKHVAPGVQAEELIYELQDYWTREGDVYLPGLGRTPSLMDVQNTLCEFGKYVRWLKTPRSSKTYMGSGPLRLPIYPKHW